MKKDMASSALAGSVHELRLFDGWKLMELKVQLSRVEPLALAPFKKTFLLADCMQ